MSVSQDARVKELLFEMAKMQVGEGGDDPSAVATTSSMSPELVSADNSHKVSSTQNDDQVDPSPKVQADQRRSKPELPQPRGRVGLARSPRLRKSQHRGIFRGTKPNRNRQTVSRNTPSGVGAPVPAPVFLEAVSDSIDNNSNPQAETPNVERPVVRKSWGNASNLRNSSGDFCRSTLKLYGYVRSFVYRGLFFYFDLVNGRYPEALKSKNGEEQQWRMAFNVYSSGFGKRIVHLGEIHSYYQVESVDGKLRWVFKDYNFYQDLVSYDFDVSPNDVANVYFRFCSFMSTNRVVKEFPYVSIQRYGKPRLYQRFLQNVDRMMDFLKKKEVDLKESLSGLTDVDAQKSSGIDSVLETAISTISSCVEHEAVADDGEEVVSCPVEIVADDNKEVASIPVDNVEDDNKEVGSSPVDDVADNKEIASIPVDNFEDDAEEVASNPVDNVADDAEEVASNPVDNVADDAEEVASNPVDNVADDAAEVASNAVDNAEGKTEQDATNVECNTAASVVDTVPISTGGPLATLEAPVVRDQVSNSQPPNKKFNRKFNGPRNFRGNASRNGGNPRPNRGRQGAHFQRNQADPASQNN